MCTKQTTASTLRDWLRDPMIRLVMESDGVTDQEMIALLRRVSTAVESRSATVPSASQWRRTEYRGAW
jgi:hypothetical protein